MSKGNKEKGLLAKLLEQGIKLLLIKECKKINNIKIDIISSSSKILKGEIPRINIIAEDINYKDLLFNEVKLEVDNLKIYFKLITNQISFKNDPIIKFKISLSQNSLKTVLLSNNWNYIGNMISKEILNRNKLEDIEIKNGQFSIKATGEKNYINEKEKIEIKADKGKIYFINRTQNKEIQIPIEKKIYIENVIIEKNLINIFGNSSIIF